MPTPSLNPFQAQDLALAQQIINDADRLIPFLQSCTNCGANVTQEIAMVQAQRDFAANVLREFGSGRTDI